MAAKTPQSQSQGSTNNPQASRFSKRRLAGKVAVVTGGSRGIGFAIAQVFANEGSAVVITGRDSKQLSEAAAAISAGNSAITSTDIVPLVCDVRQPESVSALFAEVKRRFGNVDILINNAGITQPVVSVEQTSVELWQDVIASNLTSLFLCSREVLPLMKAGATIINNLSAAAKQVFPNYATYSAAKRGALGFTLSLREELIPRGIRVTALMPGATATSMWDQGTLDASREKMIDVESVAQTVLCAVLLPPNVNLSELLLDPTGGAL
jgi:NAD(P)-dependent dehydrogenase (short-subunit alcohol dehydrogenase family)